MSDSKLKFVWVGAFLILATMLIGVAGYVAIEKASIIDALYMTVITVSTVGFGEVIPLSQLGKLFTIVLIILGTGTLAYTASQFVDYVVAGELRNMFGRKKMQNKIEALEDHYILCGFGRMGRIIAEILAENNLPFVIVDPAPRQSESSDNQYLFVTGDATHESVLIKAGILHAKGLITVVDQDVTNLYIVITAKGLSKDLYVVTKCAQEEAYSKLMWAGADKIVSPYTIGGKSIAQSIIKPNVTNFVEMAMGHSGYHIMVDEVLVKENSHISEKMIKDSNIRSHGIIIVAINKKNKGFVFNPGPDEILTAGDTVIALGRKEDFESLQNYIERG
ncbi:TrkA-N domain protein [Denitrovibrio acetiphilus DSM 12809]|uniref:TrkA-N domain protein n=1 Tax=Denitrovibrio acetiphilus (strain DSM 12809 / NBRC 114555 / N2460) TaxID=522772 RepID=D4H7Y2_DENA2|nr:potassium channel protein [Denitrovibrio acetiphilus]ADD68131.1 TrkA-N domain protein [Denitrovibrio acetiphilus DSM 12809]